MSDATTGVAQANARVSTMPKLSPPSEGATSAFAPSSVAVSSSCERKPTTSMPSSEHSQPGEQQPDRERIGTRDGQACAGSPPDLRPRAEEHVQSLARLVAAREDDAVLALAGIGLVRDQHTVRDQLVVAGEPACRRGRRPLGHGDPVVEPVGEEAPDPPAHPHPARSPDAWCVATIGVVAIASTATQVTGVIGSCRCSTSKCSRSSTRRMRKMARGESTMFGSDPFAGTITERPIGITSGGGSPCRPTRGCSARVNWPGGSLPMISRTSLPRAVARRLQLGMLHDGTPEGPREGDDDADLHRLNARVRGNQGTMPDADEGAAPLRYR